MTEGFTSISYFLDLTALALLLIPVALVPGYALIKRWTGSTAQFASV